MIFDELVDEIYSGRSPYVYADSSKYDNGYPHTNILEDLVEAIIIEFKPDFWLEIGSMLGNSAIKVASITKSKDTKTTVVCLDPFTGDVNMWAWEKDLHKDNKWRFLGLDKGRPTIYDRFLANVMQAGHDDIILPINCTSIVGVKLIQRLYQESRLSKIPSVIYLDSAHEEDETFLEIHRCWESLPEGGILFGDDWDWPAVRNDVLKYFNNIHGNTKNTQRLTSRIQPLETIGSIILYKNQWVVCK